MVLAIDVGNTNLTIGGFVKSSLAFSAHISTDTEATRDDYACRIISVLSLYGIKRDGFRGAVIASVVPELNSIIKDAVRRVAGVEAIVVGPGIKTGISIRCDAPSSVGADLICTSVAANYLYGAPALVIDMGTATKMTVVNDKGAFIGAAIIPGIMMVLRALATDTAQLPMVSLEAPDAIICKNTADCMKSGAVFGNACMIDGMVTRIMEEIGTKCKVLLTGGYATAVAPHLTCDFTLDEHLVLKGLYLIYEKNA